jgi:hypothetical protein
LICFFGRRRTNKLEASEGVAGFELKGVSWEETSGSITGVLFDVEFPKGSFAWYLGGIVVVKFDHNMKRREEFCN